MFSKLKIRLRALFRNTEVEHELDEELRFHLDREIEENIRRGMCAEEARCAALRRFGGLEQIKEECRDARGVRLIEDILQDLRYGLRTMRRNLGFTAVAIVTLSLGIGANTAIFSVVNAVLLRPLPYTNSDRLVFLSERSRQAESIFISWPNYLDWRAQNQVFEHIAVYNRDSYNLTRGGEPERLVGGQVSADLFAVLGVGAELGRVFTNDEDQPGAAPVVLLSYGLWVRRFGSDPNVINQAITLNDRSYTVVGVMPPDFQFPIRAELWVPAGQLSNRDWRNRDNHPGLYAVARLKSGVTIEQARADMEAIALGLEKQYPNTNQNHRVTVTPLKETVVRDVRWALWVLFAAAALTLLIACVNVANLLLARAAARQHEMTIRAALGASRMRLARQLLTESIMLAVTGGAAGWMLAKWGLYALVAISASSLPRASEIRLDSRVLVFTAVASVLTGILFGLAPAWRAGRIPLQQSLKEAGRSPVAGKQRTHSALVITEIALALVLLIGAGLLLRSFYRLTQVKAGFDYDHVLSFSITLPAGKYTSPEQRINFYSNLIQKLRMLPGVQSVGLTSGLPFGSSSWRTPFAVEGQPVVPPSEMPLLEALSVSPDYFRTMGIPLRAGRYFMEQDNRQHLAGRDLSRLDEGAKQVAGLSAVIIDEEFARRYWPNEHAVGKRVRLGPTDESPMLTVVGVVGRVKMDHLGVESNRVQAYFSSLQMPFANMTVVVRSQLEPSQMVTAVRQQVQAIDPNQPIYNVRTMEEVRDTSIAPERLNLTLLGLFAALSLVLATVGIYGIISHTVAQRTQEIGIRMALGARESDVLRMIVWQGLSLVIIGVTLGLAGAFALTWVMKTLLFGVSAYDLVTFVGITSLLTIVALLACLIPAYRATKVDPLVALRYE